MQHSTRCDHLELYFYIVFSCEPHVMLHDHCRDATCSLIPEVSAFVFEAAQMGLKTVSTQHHLVSRLYHPLQMSGRLEMIWIALLYLPQHAILILVALAKNLSYLLLLLRSKTNTRAVHCPHSQSLSSRLLTSPQQCAQDRTDLLT